DTLWHTEKYYREAEKTFTDLVSAYGISTEEILQTMHKIEIDNLAYFGYGIRGFILSMIETAIQVTGEKVHAADIQAIVELGRGMTGHEICLLDGVVEALEHFKDRQLILITKGDVLDQESKVKRSGLAGYFRHVEVVVDKTREHYADILRKHNVSPECFLMVGNALRSDIAPVLSLGGYAVHVPYPLSWAHEAEVDLPSDQSRFFEIPSLYELAGVVKQIELTV
ncbi:MAG TPA: HAD family hydrolase, partial [Longilinea sp.]|nr:HAD family hydrolase [Longilinea sp.]